MITSKSSPLHIASNRTRIGNLWFPSAIWYPLSYALGIAGSNDQSYSFGDQPLWHDTFLFGWDINLEKIISQVVLKSIAERFFPKSQMKTFLAKPSFQHPISCSFPQSYLLRRGFTCNFWKLWKGLYTQLPLHSGQFKNREDSEPDLLWTTIDIVLCFFGLFVFCFIFSLLNIYKIYTFKT